MFFFSLFLRFLSAFPMRPAPFVCFLLQHLFQAAQVHRQLRNSSEPPEERVLRTLKSIYYKTGAFEETQHVDSLAAAGGTAQVDAKSSLASAHAPARPLPPPSLGLDSQEGVAHPEEQVQENAAERPQPPSLAVSTRTSAVGEAGAAALAAEIMAACDAGDAVAVARGRRQMRAARVRADATVLQKLLLFYRRAEDATAMRVTQKEQRLLTALLKARGVVRAEVSASPADVSEWHEAARAQCLVLDVRTAGVLVKAYTATQDWDGVARVWAELRESGTVPNQILYNAVIKAHSTAQDVDKLKAVLSEMEAAEVPMDAYTHVPVLLAALHSNDVELVSLLPCRSVVL